MSMIKQSIARIAGAALLSFAALGVSAPAQAQPIELKNLEKGKEQLSEDRGYIFMQAPARLNAAFIKTPDEADIAEYEADWREQLEKAQDKYPRRLERWKKRAANNRNPGEKPVEPTEENFSIGAIEQRQMIFIGPQFVYDKGKDASGEKYFQYLQEVDPGEYTYYGPIFFGGDGYFGTCNCMGTVRFEVKAGEITSLGDFIMGYWADDQAMRQATPFWEPIADRKQAPIDFTVPSNLNQLPSVEAEFHAAGKINNFFRIGVGRLAPMEGVLRYERDTVIDVRAEIAAAKKAEAVAGAEARLAKARADYNSANEAAKAAEAALAAEETPETKAAAETAIEAANKAEVDMIRAEEELGELMGTAPAADTEEVVETAEEAAEDAEKAASDAL